MDTTSCILTALYALDSLDADERVLVEAHLDACSTCRSELAGFRATGTRLAEVVSRKPPAGLRTRVLAAAATTSQEPLA